MNRRIMVLWDSKIMRTQGCWMFASSDRRIAERMSQVGHRGMVGWSWIVETYGWVKLGYSDRRIIRPLDRKIVIA